MHSSLWLPEKRHLRHPRSQIRQKSFYLYKVIFLQLCVGGGRVHERRQVRVEGEGVVRLS